MSFAKLPSDAIAQTLKYLNPKNSAQFIKSTKDVYQTVKYGVATASEDKIRNALVVFLEKYVSAMVSHKPKLYSDDSDFHVYASFGDIYADLSAKEDYSIDISLSNGSVKNISLIKRIVSDANNIPRKFSIFTRTTILALNISSIKDFIKTLENNVIQEMYKRLNTVKLDAMIDNKVRMPSYLGLLESPTYKIFDATTQLDPENIFLQANVISNMSMYAQNNSQNNAQNNALDNVQSKNQNNAQNSSKENTNDLQFSVYLEFLDEKVLLPNFNYNLKDSSWFSSIIAKPSDLLKNASSAGGAMKSNKFKYNGRLYVVKIGPKGGKYISVKGRHVYI